MGAEAVVGRPGRRPRPAARSRALARCLLALGGAAALASGQAFLCPSVQRTPARMTSTMVDGSRRVSSAPATPDVLAKLAVAAEGEAGTLTARDKYVTGITWYLSHFVIGIGNDGIMKFLGGSMTASQIVFMRFSCAGLVLLPLLLVQPSGFKTARLWMHAVRGSLLALGIGLWCVGLQLLPFASAVVVNNTMPFFKMLFAKVLLGENVGKERWLASLGGFIGCLIVFNPTAATFKPQSLFLILSAMCFAMLDIMNKKWSVSEPLVSTLFYGSVATALLSAPLALRTWSPLGLPQLGLFALLGVSRVFPPSSIRDK